MCVHADAQVAHEGKRPPFMPNDPGMSSALGELMVDCWAQEGSERPRFDAVTNRIKRHAKAARVQLPYTQAPGIKPRDTTP